MLRASTNGLLRRITINESKCGSTDFSLEFVRWRRKPRWLPVAKSKLFRVPERKEQDPDERAELMRLHNNYNTQMRSLRGYLREELKRHEEISTADHIVLTPEQEEAAYQACLAENDAWNKAIAAERKVRLEKEREGKIAYVKQRLEAGRMRKEEQRERVEAEIRREKELAKTHITRENLDVAIEQALANPVDYNFAIDLEGNLYHGRVTTEPTDDGNKPKQPDEPQPPPAQLMASN